MRNPPLPEYMMFSLLSRHGGARDRRKEGKMRRQAVLLFATAATLLMASVAVLAATTVLKGGAINQVRVVRGEDASAYNNSTTFTDIPGVATTVSVPRGEKGLILARYSAETICYIVEGTTNTGDNKCSVKIMVVNNSTGQQMEACPCNQGTQFAFDSTSAGTENIYAQESHSMDRSLIVGPGKYTVKAQWAVTHSDVRFRVDDWSFTVEKARAV
jgi:hypothetical protein